MAYHMQKRPNLELEERLGTRQIVQSPLNNPVPRLLRTCFYCEAGARASG